MSRFLAESALEKMRVLMPKGASRVAGSSETAALGALKNFNLYRIALKQVTKVFYRIKSHPASNL